MSPALEQLVREAMEVTGSPLPDLLEEDAPVLADAALAGDDNSFYLIGLIGGKEVGKSALVNALVGQPITAVTSFGAGTEIAVAYAHVSQEQALRALLDKEVAGQYRIVTHNLERPRRMVLLDLPDIDSHYSSHVQVTRTMLRHMLFPVWVTSIEKYADQQLQAMLARVADGNAPENFVFCMNKVDQLKGPAEVNGSAMEQLRVDYADRLKATLSISNPPLIYLISANSPTKFDVPALRKKLWLERTPEAIRESKESAAARQDQALLSWLDEQDLPQRAHRLARLERDAEELVTARVAGPIMERIVPLLLDDPATRFAMTDEILQRRVVHWPIINLIHTILQPSFALLRNAVARGALPMQGAEAMVDAVIRESGESVQQLVQSAFAQLRQSQPVVAPLYAENKLWEDMPAEIAARDLRRVLGQTVERQRLAARQRLTGPGVAFAAPLRWLLTVGALLWFPFIQPILSALLSQHDRATFASVVGLIISVLGVDYLWKSVGFLLIYFAALWLTLRWNTQRKVSRLMSRWREGDQTDPSLNFATQTVGWLGELIAPITTARQRMQSMAERAATLQAKIPSVKAA